MSELATIIALAIASIPFAVCVMLGAANGNFELITAGAVPLSGLLSAIVSKYFDNKTISTLKEENKSLKSLCGGNK